MDNANRPAFLVSPAGLRYPFFVKNLPVPPPMWFLITSFILCFSGAWMPGEVKARSSFWISARDTNACIVSAVIQYDTKLEDRIRRENGVGNAVLQMDIHTQEPQELCTMLLMQQGDHRWRPLLCVTNIRGNIYSGYLILPPEFTLASPLEISLGERTIEAKFKK
jgi:hypothetical protein